MCFIIHKNNLKPKVAKEDTPVWKEAFLLGGNKLCTPYTHFIYEKGYIYHEDKVDFRERVLSGYFNIVLKNPKEKPPRGRRRLYKRDSIFIGLHAHTEPQQWGSLLKLVKMYIPKGARYWINPGYKEVVTETLVWY